jgi:predicted anti-sigma-YlaC factor YlaD
MFRPDAHVTHLLVAYVHQQLPRTQRERVARHIARCESCRAAFARENELARDLRTGMMQMGTPERGQLARMLPAIMAETRGAQAVRRSHRVMLPSPSMALALAVVCAVFFGTLLYRPSNASAAANPITIGAATADTQAPPSDTSAAVLVPAGTQVAYTVSDAATATDSASDGTPAAAPQAVTFTYRLEAQTATKEVLGQVLREVTRQHIPLKSPTQQTTKHVTIRR